MNAGAALGSRAPAFRLLVDDRDVGGEFFNRFVSLSLTESRDETADQLDLVLSDQDGRTPIPPQGALVSLALGWKGQALVEKGLFTVDDVEWSGAPDQLTVRARSADFTRGFRIRRDTSWRGKTLKDVLAVIAARNGWSLAVAPDLAGIQVPILDQSRESDGALLRRLGRAHDAAATVKAGRLVFARIGAGVTAATGTDIPRLTIRRSEGDQARWSRPKRDDYPGVSAVWHDLDGAQKRTVTVGDAEGAKTLRQTFGSEADAQRAARAEHGRVQRGKSTFGFTLALARPEIYPERPVSLEGFKPEIDAIDWLVKQVVHNLGDGGFTTGLELESR